MKKLFVFLGVFLLLSGICFAQGNSEQLTITTYYPSPYGVYKNLRLFPYAATNFVAEGDCSATGTKNQQGDLAYSQTDNKPLYCDGSKWKAMGGGGGAMFTVKMYTPTPLAYNYIPPAAYCTAAFNIDRPEGATKITVIVTGYVWASKAYASTSEAPAIAMRLLNVTDTVANITDGVYGSFAVNEKVYFILTAGGELGIYTPAITMSTYLTIDTTRFKDVKATVFYY